MWRTHIPPIHSAHVPTPNMGHPNYEGAHHKPSPDTGEAGRGGWLIGKLIKVFFKYGLVGSAYGGSTVLDVLRMKTPNAEFFVWQRIPAMWLGLLGYLCLGYGAVAHTVLQWFAGLSFITQGGEPAMRGINSLSLPWLNAIFAWPIPNMYFRGILIAKGLGLGARGLALEALVSVKFASLSLLDWYTYLDLASMLIPVGLTLAATVKYLRMARKRNFNEGDECEGRPWSAAQKGWLGFAMLLWLLGGKGKEEFGELFFISS